MIILPQPKERSFIFNKNVSLDSIGELSKSILCVDEDDLYISEIYNFHGLQYTPKPIKIYIDSFGGSVYQCFGILSIIEKSKTPIHTIVTGCAMSAAFLMAISGHKRYAYSSATFMYHQLSHTEYGKLKDLDNCVIECKRLQQMIEKHTLKMTKIPKDKLKDVYEDKEDWFLSAKEALKHGVVDEII